LTASSTSVTRLPGSWTWHSSVLMPDHAVAITQTARPHFVCSCAPSASVSAYTPVVVHATTVHAVLAVCVCTLKFPSVPLCRVDIPGPTTPVGTRTDYSVGPWDYSTCATRHLMAWSARTMVEEYSDRKLYMTRSMWRTLRRIRLVLSPQTDWKHCLPGYIRRGRYSSLSYTHHLVITSNQSRATQHT
jgi:hypothetical protein